MKNQHNCIFMKPKILTIIDSLNEGIKYEAGPSSIEFNSGSSLIAIYSIESGYKVRVLRPYERGFLFFSEMQNGNRLLWELVCCEILPREFLPLTKTIRL